ncbi:MAG: efflux RND transporter periplasmic adaptor subunit [Tepidisphaeraceae bacterium]|jgi:RND family efflux transporter MFP subunit
MESHDTIPKDLPKIGLAKLALIAIAAAVIFAAAFAVRYAHLRSHDQELAAAAQQAADSPPVVDAARPKPTGAVQDLVLPGNVSPMQETALYARVNGYLKRWYFDIGAHVEAGQLLAEIDAPDVDAQLNEARAAVDQAKANAASAQTNDQLAQATYVRYKGLLPTGSVTQEDLDTRQSTAAQAAAAKDATNAAVKSAQATVQQLEAEQGFEKIVAPFTGTITARNYDVGALMSPTDTAPGHEIFRIAQTDKLRIWVYVPQSYVTLMRLEQPVAFLASSNYPGRKFMGIVARTAGALDPATRTLQTELDFDNADGRLWAGMYGQVIFNIHREKPVLTIPTSALVFNAQGTQVAIVDQGVIHFRKITVGRDLGTEIEVATGLTGDEQVVSNPGERLAEGSQVQLAGGNDATSVAAGDASAGNKLTQIDPPSGGNAK